MARAYLYFLSTNSERSSELDSAKAAIPASKYFMGFEYGAIRLTHGSPADRLVETHLTVSLFYCSSKQTKTMPHPHHAMDQGPETSPINRCD